MPKIQPVIMAGGTGSRLWPASRKMMPKQFLSLASDNSMLVDTLLRLKDLDTAPPIVICNEDHRFLCAEEMRKAGVDHGQIILEPEGKNTAPAIALAALACDASDSLLVLAADHLIQGEEYFNQAVLKGFERSAAGALVAFGVVPSRPHTGYGYIKAGSVEEVSKINEFVEKPDSSTAQKYLESGQYLWNSGMFMFSAESYLEELRAHREDIFVACERAMGSASTDMLFIRPDAEEFAKCPDDSVDYAVMEKTANAEVVPLSARWSDLGCWESLWSVSEKDANGNVFRGDVISEHSEDCYIDAGDKLVATIGLKNVVLVRTKDAILVADKSRMQDVKKVVEKLKGEGRKEYVHGREVVRPWGKYDSIDFGDRDQVKRITVNPGAKLSVQMHHHRAEHWIVVSGTARVRNGDSEFFVSENESTYIPIGQVHSLENPGKIPLEMIEVQTGTYLGEDDIVRFEDKYGRT